MIVAILFLIAGLAGIFIPALPGIPLAFIGYIFLGFSFRLHSIPIFTCLLVLTVLSIVSDWVSSSVSTKLAGGSKWGMIGAFIGLIVGIFTGNIFLLLAFPFIFSFLFEFSSTGKLKKSFKVGLYAIVGLIASVGFRIFIYFLMLVIFFSGIIRR